MPITQHFGFKLVANTQFVALVEQVHQPVARQLNRHTPAHHALLEQNTQRDGVVAVERVPGDKRQLTLGAHIHHAEIAGFQQEVAVFDIALQLSQFRGSLHQRQRRQHHLLTATGERLRHIQPVAHFGRTAFAAYRFAKIDNVSMTGGGLLVKIFQRFFRPVVEHGS